MLDHVQIPDLALKEANRVLKSNGFIIVGLYVEGGKSGHTTLAKFLKNKAKKFLANLGIKKLKDFHTFHPTYQNLIMLIEDNGFKVIDSYWQPYWKDKVVYIKASKRKNY